MRTWPPADDGAPDRDRRHDRGRAGEQAAAEFLIALGYRVEARNLRSRHGEIDLLARQGRTWVAVEVKARSQPAPERAVTPAQLARCRRALASLVPSLRPTPRALRIDVVAVQLRAGRAIEIRHFRGEPSDP